ncbi:MAG: hypothetical protein HYZ75_17990 [Elusimicrobia bacterium]|nr:hypothetical protein [Elusimicrobiota bacterium]
MKSAARTWELAGAAALAAAVLAPMADTDLWWHLSAGRAFLDGGAWPRVELASWTLRGAPWTDFEWLAQAQFAAVRLVGGAWGLWLLKGLLLAAAAGGVLATARAAALAAPGRAAALALFAAGVLPRADLRTELCSLALFAWLMYWLECLRAADWPRKSFKSLVIGCACLFAGWANLHGGFPLGLVLLGSYLLAPARRHPSWLLALVAAAAGTLINPYGFGLWSVVLGHGRDAGGLSPLISEWSPLGFSQAGHYGAWLTVLAATGVVALAALRGKAPALPELFALALAASTVRHVRLAGYAAVVAPLLAAAAARLSHGLWERARPRLAAAALCGAAFWICLSAAKPWRLVYGAYDPVLVPVEAAAWLAPRKDLLALPMYNPWSWGGYLADRLKVPVFQDGRYLFHGLLAEQAEAVKSPEAWQAFLYKKGAGLVLLENGPLMRDTTLKAPDGTSIPVQRPYYVAYMPREDWALVWFDDAALVFVRRDMLPMGTREFRWLKPRDGKALAEARRLGLIDEMGLAAEAALHAAERPSVEFPL